MSAEEQEMLAKISQLAGQINRHKNQQAGVVSVPSQNQRMSHRWVDLGRTLADGFADGKSWNRGGGHYQRGGYRVGKPATHRHKTLILNNPLQTNKSEIESGGASDASSSSWVTKTDRHLQLINTNVYEKATRSRTKAIEQTRLQKQQHSNDRERAKIINHFSHMANSGGMAVANGLPATHYEIVVQGIRFFVTKNGSKLVRVPGVSPTHKVDFNDVAHHSQGDHNALSATPKMVAVGGVKFYRSKNGNLYRHGIVKAQRQSGGVKKLDQACQIFSTTGTSLLQPRAPTITSCHYYGEDIADRTNSCAGSCPKGPQCRYIHDASKVAVCRDFLHKGDCLEGDSCDLSHDLAPERTPHCLHFAKGNCTNPNCRYSHVTVSPGALVCRPFGMYGFCGNGASCSDRHVFECPDFSNTGTCRTKACKLPHRERASVLRKAGAARDNNADDEMEDVSSDDEEEAIDSDDVDSDEVEEFFGDDDVPDLDFATQKDFIKF